MGKDRQQIIYEEITNNGWFSSFIRSKRSCASFYIKKAASRQAAFFLSSVERVYRSLLRLGVTFFSSRVEVLVSVLPCVDVFVLSLVTAGLLSVRVSTLG